MATRSSRESSAKLRKKHNRWLAFLVAALIAAVTFSKPELKPVLLELDRFIQEAIW